MARNHKRYALIKHGTLIKHGMAKFRNTGAATSKVISRRISGRVVIYGKLICISQLQCKMFARLTSASTRMHTRFSFHDMALDVPYHRAMTNMV
jgi:hypothetical protein